MTYEKRPPAGCRSGGGQSETRRRLKSSAEKNASASYIITNDDQKKNTGSKKARDHSLFVLGYAIEELKKRTITARGVILLAHVDRAINPFWTRQPEMSEHGLDREPYEDYSTKYLARILQAGDYRTVVSTIRQLRSHVPKLLWAKPMGRCRWRLWTKSHDSDEDERKGSLYIPHPILMKFEEGVLTPMEALIMSKIVSFTRDGNSFYASNKWIGKQFGVEGHRIQKIIKQLIKKVKLQRTFVPTDENDGKTVRFLNPPRWPGLYQREKFTKEEYSPW